MDRNRRLLISILAVLVLSAIIAIVDISISMKPGDKKLIQVKKPEMGPGVGIVRIEGPISLSSNTGYLGVITGAEAIVKRLDDLQKNRNIRAIVVRINSPGGTVGATQEIFQKIWKIRKKKNIPVVASMGEIAASGGYYTAAACSRIMANHGTITGSIGVIAMSPNMKRLFDKLGIRMNVIKSGRYKDILASYRDLSTEERRILQEMIDSSYKKFLKDVALGRNMNQSDIAKYADGRVMNGITALDYKLIDGIGTFEDAIDSARELADLSEDSPVYDDVRTPFQQVLMSMQGFFRGRSVLEKNINYGESQILEYRYIP